MSILIKYTQECDCGGEMSCTELNLTQVPGGTVEISLDLLGEMTIECDTCHRRAYVPGIADYIEDIE